MGKRILLLNTGSEAAGMHAAYCEILRRAAASGHDVYMCMYGYDGLIVGGENNIIKLDPADPRFAPDTLSRGGVINGVSRTSLTRAMRREAYVLNQVLRNLEGFEVLGVFGGNGGMLKAKEIDEILSANSGPTVVAFPRSMDADIAHTGNDILGAYTAVERAAEEIVAYSEYARASRRNVVVEMMGRNSPYPLILSALRASEKGASITALFAPETQPHMGYIEALMRDADGAPKTGQLLLVSEGVLDLDSPGHHIYPVAKGHSLGPKKPVAGDFYAERLAEAGIPVQTSVQLGYSLRTAVAVEADLRLARNMAEAFVTILGSEQNPRGMVVTQNNQTFIMPFSELTSEQRVLPANDPLYDALAAAGIPLAHDPQPKSPVGRNMRLVRSVLDASGFPAPKPV